MHTKTDSEDSKRNTLISWQQSFYGWKYINDETYFSSEDYVIINSDVQLVRISGESASKSLFEASHVNFFGSFKLYQCDSPSEIRKNMPLRFFYSRKYGKVFELNGKNGPFYSLMSTLRERKEISQEPLDEDLNKWVLDNAYKYIKIFFDNVRGRHGRFELVENMEEYQNRINQYSEYIKRYKIKANADPSEEANVDEGTPDVETIDIKELPNILKKAEAKLTTTQVKDNTIHLCRCEHVYMVFQDTLFIADVQFNIDPDFGMITLENERAIKLV